MRNPLGVWAALALMAAAPLTATAAVASQPQPSSGSMNVRWDPGSPACRPGTEAPIQVHAYNSSTYFLRESLCLSSEAPFMYLLIGSGRALLIDSGDFADAGGAPLARTILSLLPVTPAGRLPLVVVHTHRYPDDRTGDSQLARLPGVQIVGRDLINVKRFYGLMDWPNGQATLDLGGRPVDVLPAPGHQDTEMVFFDRQTALMFTGDFLLPGPLLVDDAAADAASAKRIAAFAADKPIAYVLGGQIEMNLDGALYASGSHYHPGERPLQLSKTELMALPEIVEGFRGVYARRAGFTLINQAYEVDLAEAALAIATVVFMAGLAALIVRARRWFLAMKSVRLASILGPEGAGAI